MNVRCSCCHREELWTLGPGGETAIQVVRDGGGRRPSEAAPLAAWRVLRRSREGRSGVVVGVCAACRQPLVAPPGEGAPVPWVLATPGGDVSVGAQIIGPHGVVDADAAEAFLESQFPRRIVPTLEEAIGNLFILPIIVWMSAWMLGLFLALAFLTGAVNGPHRWVLPGIVFTAIAASGLAWWTRKDYLR